MKTQKALVREPLSFIALSLFALMGAAGCDSGSGGGTGATNAGPVSGPRPAPNSELPPSEPVDPSIPLARAASLQIGRSGLISGKSAVAMDFRSMDLEIDIDNTANRSTGQAEIRFVSHQDGYPYFLMDGTVLSASLNGSAVSFSKAKDPGGLNDVQLLGAVVRAGAENVLTLNYELPADAVGYRAAGVGFVTAMADIDSGNFFEAYGPANYEDDQFAMRLTVRLEGVSSSHRVFTNGDLTEISPYSWQVEFPEYFNSSGFYFHVTDLALAVRNSTYRGMTKDIPLTVYAADSASADTAIARLPGLFQELEAAYGPYLHESFTAYISGSGGMEHNGATITSLSALGHELTHSWFGRGVLPGGGASGWLDESIASWRDYDYQRASGTPLRTATNLATLSKYERFTPYNSYADGRTLMAEFDYLLASSGGLKPVLKDFFAERKAQVIATVDFKEFFTRRTGLDVEWMFERYVFGKSVQAPGEEGSPVPIPPENGVNGSLHPRPLTKEDIERLR